jgi:hypothetical protein
VVTARRRRRTARNVQLLQEYEAHQYLRSRRFVKGNKALIWSAHAGVVLIAQTPP